MYIQVSRGQNKLNYIEMSDGRKSKGKHEAKRNLNGRFKYDD